MRIAVTGTPGTGKTSATSQLDTDHTVVHLNDVIERDGLTTGTDDERGSVIADMDAVADWLEDRDDIVFESHLAHQFPADRVVVLRCHPAQLERRLSERGTSPASAAENAESEALDLILAEAVDRHGESAVYELDTTDRPVAAVTADIEQVIRGERQPEVGVVSFVDYLA